MRIRYFIDDNEDLTPVYKRGNKVSRLIKYGQEPTGETLEEPDEESTESTPLKLKKKDYVNSLLNGEMTMDDLSQKNLSDKFQKIVQRRYNRKLQKTRENGDSEKENNADEQFNSDIYDRITMPRIWRPDKEIIFRNRTWTGPHEVVDQEYEATSDVPYKYKIENRTDKTRRRSTVRVFKTNYDNKDENGNPRTEYVGERRVVIKKPEKAERWEKRPGKVERWGEKLEKAERRKKNTETSTEEPYLIPR